MDKQRRRSFAQSRGPLGQIAVDMEQARVQQLQLLLEGNAIYACHVDCAVFERRRRRKARDCGQDPLRLRRPVFKLDKRPYDRSGR